MNVFRGVSVGNYGQPGAGPHQLVSHGTATNLNRNRGSGGVGGLPRQPLSDRNGRRFDNQPQRLTRGQKTAARVGESYENGYRRGYLDALNGVPSQFDNGVGLGSAPFATQGARGQQHQISTQPTMSPTQRGNRRNNRNGRGNVQPATTNIDPNQPISPISGGNAAFSQPHHFETRPTQGGHQHQLHPGRTQFTETQQTSQTYAQPQQPSSYAYASESTQNIGMPSQLLTTNGEEMEQVQEFGCKINIAANSYHIILFNLNLFKFQYPPLVHQELLLTNL